MATVSLARMMATTKVLMAAPSAKVAMRTSLMLWPLVGVLTSESLLFREWVQASPPSSKVNEHWPN